MTEKEGVVIIHGAGPHSRGELLTKFVNRFIKTTRARSLISDSDNDYKVEDVSVHENEDGELEHIDVVLKRSIMEGDEKLIRVKEGFWSDTYDPHTSSRITRWVFEWARLITESRIFKKAQIEQVSSQRRALNSTTAKVSRGKDPEKERMKYERRESRAKKQKERAVKEPGKRFQSISNLIVLASWGWIFYRILSWMVIAVLLMLEVKTTGEIMNYIEFFLIASVFVALFLIALGGLQVFFPEFLERTSGARVIRILSGLVSLAIGWLGLPVLLFMFIAQLIGVIPIFGVLFTEIAFWHIQWEPSVTWLGINGQFFWGILAGLAFTIWLFIPSTWSNKYKAIYYDVIVDLLIPIGVPITALIFTLASITNKIPLIGESVAKSIRSLSDRVIVAFVGDVELYLEDDVQAYQILKRVKNAAQDIFQEDAGDQVNKIHIIGHSLGSVIAYEALASGLDGDLKNKVATLVTMGSPLDKIRNLLMEHQGLYPRFNLETLSLPTHVQWINLYAKRDLVADLFDLNIPTSQYLVSEDVDILAAHGSYWEDDLTMNYIIQSILYPDESPLDRKWADDEELQGLAKVGITTEESLRAQSSVGWTSLLKNTALSKNTLERLVKKIDFDKSMSSGLKRSQ